VVATPILPAIPLISHRLRIGLLVGLICIDANGSEQGLAVLFGGVVANFLPIAKKNIPGVTAVTEAAAWPG